MTAKLNKVDVRVGQIWQRNEYLNGELLPNQGFVKVVDIQVGYAVLCASTENGKVMPTNKYGSTRQTNAQLKRFGRRGGYRLHKDVEQ